VTDRVLSPTASHSTSGRRLYIRRRSSFQAQHNPLRLPLSPRKTSFRRLSPENQKQRTLIIVSGTLTEPRTSLVGVTFETSFARFRASMATVRQYHSPQRLAASRHCPLGPSSIREIEIAVGIRYIGHRYEAGNGRPPFRHSEHPSQLQGSVEQTSHPQHAAYSGVNTPSLTEQPTEVGSSHLTEFRCENTISGEGGARDCIGFGYLDMRHRMAGQPTPLETVCCGTGKGEGAGEL
jgi:hypothetical protein